MDFDIQNFLISNNGIQPIQPKESDVYPKGYTSDSTKT